MYNHLYLRRLLFPTVARLIMSLLYFVGNSLVVAETNFEPVEDFPEQRNWLETAEGDSLIHILVTSRRTFLIVCPAVYVRIWFVVPPTVEARAIAIVKGQLRVCVGSLARVPTNRECSLVCFASEDSRVKRRNDTDELAGRFPTRMLDGRMPLNRASEFGQNRVRYPSEVVAAVEREHPVRQVLGHSPRNRSSVR